MISGTLLIAFFIFLLFCAFILIFTLPQFSLIPYFPSNKKDLPFVLKALGLKNNQSVIDLGAGDGIIVFSAASEAYKRNLNTQFVAIDTNPILVLIMYFRRLFHPNKKNIRIMSGDMFKLNLQPDRLHYINIMKSKGKRLLGIKANETTVYLYISPWLLEKITDKIKKEIGRCSIISYYYPIRSLKGTEKKIKGLKNIYSYTISSKT